MAVRIRRNILTLGDNSPEVHWYRRAVSYLQAKPTSDPTSWRYMAAVHGVPPGTPYPPGASGYWEECQHQTWFFLPWHRGYLAAFEAVVARAIVDLGGPEEWALPYWDYTANPASTPNPQLMPPSFFSRTIPGTALPNSLWSPRRTVTNGNFGLSGPVVSLAALAIPDFTGPATGVNPGFGGPITPWNHGSGQNGGVENLPHNAVHGQIGGLMGNPDTAGLDPIFWLHHCNIDRLWEKWRTRWTTAADPTDLRWRRNLRFNMHDGGGHPFDFSSEEMLDTAIVLHGYVYDDVPHVAPPVVVMAADQEPLDEEPHVMARMLGASTAPVEISGPRATTMVRIEPAANVGPLADDTRHIWLRLENITGTGMPGNYNVYVDFPNDGRAPAWIGLLSTFGIERASRADATHPGGGLSTAFDITALAGVIGINTGNVERLKIDFERISSPESFDDLPQSLADIAPSLNRPVSVRVGRIGLYTE